MHFFFVLILSKVSYHQHNTQNPHIYELAITCRYHAISQRHKGSLSGMAEIDITAQVALDLLTLS